jgi:RsmE family RNA methyltransferase
MNLILIAEDEISSQTVLLTDYRAEHIIKVLKSKVGDTLRLGVINGDVGTGEVLSVQKNAVEIKFTPECKPPKAPEVSIVMSLPRPKAFRRILFGMVSAGIKDIHIINSWRVEKSYWDSPYITPEHIRRYCLEALSQSKDTIMPAINFHRFFMEFMEEALPAIPSDRKRFLAHPYAAEQSELSAPAVVAIGPEGGFVEREIETFYRFGFQSFSTGERVLTTEHFVPFVLGKLLI